MTTGAYAHFAGVNASHAAFNFTSPIELIQCAAAQCGAKADTDLRWPSSDPFGTAEAPGAVW